MQNHPIREEWLLKAVAYLEPIFQKYGYQIPDMKQPYFWTKDDGTDINNFKQAADLTVELNAKIEKYRKKSFSIDISSKKRQAPTPLHATTAPTTPPPATLAAAASAISRL